MKIEPLQISFARALIKTWFHLEPDKMDENDHPYGYCIHCDNSTRDVIRGHTKKCPIPKAQEVLREWEESKRK